LRPAQKAFGNIVATTSNRASASIGPILFYNQ
jgi:hypothetical protein